MKKPQYDYTVMGGDRRQVYLAEELARQQKRVCCYSLMSDPAPSCRTGTACMTAKSLEDACSSSPCIICPIPMSKNGYDINHNTPDSSLTLDSLLSCLHPGQFLFAGCIPHTFQEKAEQKGICACDLMEDSSLAVYNTIATAEGALCEAISKSPENLHGSHCAVLGYGKCGRTLTQYLKGMFCHVHVYSAEETECANAALIAEEAGDFSDFEKMAEKIDFVFNTVPALVVTSRILSRMKPSVTVIDIASAPGGIDYDEAKRLGINAVLCPGLPGTYAPLSSARAVKAAIEAKKAINRSKKRSDYHCL